MARLSESAAISERSGKMGVHPSDPLVIDVVGDFMLEHRLSPVAVQEVRGLFAGADVVIANVDTVLSARGTPVPKWANLRGPREISHDLSALSIDVVALANNHAMDFRAEGMLDTCRAFEEAGILHAGAGPDLAAASAPAVCKTRHGAVAVISIACTLPLDSAAGPNWPGIAPLRVRTAFAVDETLLAEQPGTMPSVWTSLDESDFGRVRQEVANARTLADYVLVVVHWGVPAPWRAPIQPTLQQYQLSLGRRLIDAGADAVIGNHAHELHGIDLYRGCPIAYCIGNFWIDTIAAYPWMGRESMVLRLMASGGAINRIEVVPLLLDENGIPRPDPSWRAINELNEQSRAFEVHVEEIDGRWIVRNAISD
jgi:poly-gamma-glutamate capsule biosynthesis protein CapA/YwtB (metallophosphatase superfamily)